MICISGCYSDMASKIKNNQFFNQCSKYPVTRYTHVFLLQLRFNRIKTRILQHA